MTTASTNNPDTILSVSPQGTVNTKNPFASQDYATVINAFEKNTADNPREEYALASHYKDVYSTRNFSERVQDQMAYYPGMHQSGTVPKEDPAKTNAQNQAESGLNYWQTSMDSPDGFMNALRNNSQDFDYATIFGSDTDAKTRAEHIGRLFTECIPCFDRKLDLNSLLPDGNLIEIHNINIQMRSDLLDQIKDLLGPGIYIDICELLNLLSKMCPQDLLAMLVLFSQYLAKLNLDVKFNIDFIVNLIGPILSPFLNALSSWLDKWVQMILGPMLCVVDHINETIALSQQVKIPFSSPSVSLTFEEPDSKKYNPQVPDIPDEETYLAGREIADGWQKKENKMSPEERAVVDKKWEELRKKNQEQQHTTINRYTPGDGTRWSKTYSPPEKQDKPKSSEFYVDVSPLTNSIIQIRNVLQGSIQYMNDWFNYINQMVYDLIGTDYGWQKKKAQNTRTKSSLIQLIAIIKALLEANAKNGLECGVKSNFNEGQMKYIFESSLPKYTNTQFKMNDDGTIQIINPGDMPAPKVTDTTSTQPTSTTQTTNTSTINLSPTGTPIEVPENITTKQKPVKSGIIVNNCLKDLTQEQLSEARKWIAQYEKGK